MRALDAIIAKCVDLGVDSQNIFGGTDVDIPGGGGPYLSVLETGGPPPVSTHNAGVLQTPSFQFTARGDLYPAVAALIDIVYRGFGGTQSLSNVDLSGVFFLWIRPTASPMSLPLDANMRVRLAVNIRTCHR